MDHDLESLNFSLSDLVLMKVESRPESGWWGVGTSGGLKRNERICVRNNVRNLASKSGEI